MGLSFRLSRTLTKSIVGLAKEIHDLAIRARAVPSSRRSSGRHVHRQQHGRFGSLMSAPIINYPQAAILSMETITRRPVVVGHCHSQYVEPLRLVDHRILDGAVIGRFSRSVKHRLESYDDTTPIY